MDQTLNIGWTQDRARYGRKSYRRAFRLALLIEAALAIAALVAPLWLSSWLAAGTSDPGMALEPNWIRAWAIAFLAWIFIQFPAANNAPRERWQNFAAVISRLLQAVGYVLIGLFWLAAVEAALFLLLAVMLHRHAMTELMSRP